MGVCCIIAQIYYGIIQVAPTGKNQCTSVDIPLQDELSVTGTYKGTRDMRSLLINDLYYIIRVNLTSKNAEELQHRNTVVY